MITKPLKTKRNLWIYVLVIAFSPCRALCQKAEARADTTHFAADSSIHKAIDSSREHGHLMNKTLYGVTLGYNYPIDILNFVFGYYSESFGYHIAIGLVGAQCNISYVLKRWSHYLLDASLLYQIGPSTLSSANTPVLATAAGGSLSINFFGFFAELGLSYALKPVEIFNEIVGVSPVVHIGYIH